MFIKLQKILSFSYNNPLSSARQLILSSNTYCTYVYIIILYYQNHITDYRGTDLAIIHIYFLCLAFY